MGEGEGDAGRKLNRGGEEEEEVMRELKLPRKESESLYRRRIAEEGLEDIDSMFEWLWNG